MSKSYKLKDGNYIDSTSIVHEKTPLNYTILGCLREVNVFDNYDNDCTKMPMNTFSHYIGTTIGIPNGNVFFPYGTVIKLVSLAGYHIICIGNDVRNNCRIALRSFINNAWTDWYYV